MPTDQKDFAGIAVERLFVEVEFESDFVSTGQIAEMLDIVDRALAVTLPRQSDFIWAPALNYSRLLRLSRTPLVVQRLEFGSPFKLLAWIPGLKPGSARAALAFFRNLMFIEPEKSRREAEAALTWEKVYAARIENLKSIADMLAAQEQQQNTKIDTPRGRADYVMGAMGELLRLSERFHDAGGRLNEFTVGDQTIARHRDSELPEDDSA